LEFPSAFSDLVERAGVAKAGVLIEVISRRLGHSIIAVTVDRYIQVYEERDAAAAAEFMRQVS